ncbi:MAG: DM13 domain-containing protein [Chloroflexota bacterium]|jgi:hypothetical protein|nr:DM13 domain-containing protein [Chloroflexota bacterium]
MRRKYLLIIAATLGCTLALPTAWYLGSPLFINRTVDEVFPVAQAAPQPVATATVPSDATVRPTLQQVPATERPAVTTTSSPMEPVVDAEAAVTPAATQTAPPLPTKVPTPTVAPPTEAPTPTVAPPTAAPSEPVILKRGHFHPVEHRATGDATIYQLADGTRILRLENFDVLNGPDLYVYLARAEDADDEAPILERGFVSLGRLKGNQGNQNYVVPADLDLRAFHSVSIWCQRFSVNFATAPLR